MKLQTLKPSTRTLGVLAAAAILLLLAGIFSYCVESQNLGTASRELQAKQKQVDDGRKVAGQLEDAEKNFLDTQSQMAFLETSVATYAYVPTLLQQMERLAQSLDLRVVSVRPVPAAPAPAPAIKKTSEDAQAAPETASKPSGAQQTETASAPKPYEEMKIDVDVEGSYWSTRSFIFQLTRFPKIVAVNEIQMSPASAAMMKHSPKLQVRLNLTAYVFPAATTVDSGTTPPATPQAGTKSAELKWRSNSEG